MTAPDLSGSVILARLQHRIRELTAKPVFFFHMNDWQPEEPNAPQVLPSPCVVECPDQYRVYLNENLPEHMAAHELLHIVLIQEGYPEPQIVEGMQCRNSFYRTQFIAEMTNLMNKFIHPEVYRRMEGYGLDMVPYQDRVSKELADLARHQFVNGLVAFPLARQAQVFNVWDLLALGEPGHRALSIYKTNARDIYEVADKSSAFLKTIGLATPETSGRVAELLLEEIISFGIRLGDEPDNDLWRALRWTNQAKVT